MSFEGERIKTQRFWWGGEGNQKIKSGLLWLDGKRWRCGWSSWGCRSRQRKGWQQWSLAHFLRVYKCLMHTKTPRVLGRLLPSLSHDTELQLVNIQYAMKTETQKNSMLLLLIKQLRLHELTGGVGAYWTLLSFLGQSWTSAYLSILIAIYTDTTRRSPVSPVSALEPRQCLHPTEISEHKSQCGSGYENSHGIIKSTTT